MQHFLFLFKISVTALSLYWRNDTPPLSPDRVHPHISSFLRLLVLCLVRLVLFVIYYSLFIFFFKERIPFIGSLTQCHTSVFNALLFFLFFKPVICLVCKENQLVQKWVNHIPSNAVLSITTLKKDLESTLKLRWFEHA